MFIKMRLTQTNVCIQYVIFFSIMKVEFIFPEQLLLDQNKFKLGSAFELLVAGLQLHCQIIKESE